MDNQSDPVLDVKEEQFTLTNGSMTGCDRRFKVLPMAPDLVFSMVFNCLSGRDKECFSEVNTLVLLGLPVDVRIEGISYNPSWNVILLRLHSSAWPIIESNDVPILNWGTDIELKAKKMLLQPYTSFDLLEMVNETRSKMGMEHISFNHSDRPVWLKDILVMQNDTPPEPRIMVNNSSQDINDAVYGEVNNNG